MLIYFLEIISPILENITHKKKSIGKEGKQLQLIKFFVPPPPIPKKILENISHRVNLRNINFYCTGSSLVFLIKWVYEPSSRQVSGGQISQVILL